MPKTSSPLPRPFRYAVTAGFFLLVTAGRLSAQAANLLPNPGFEQDENRNGVPDGWEDVETGEAGRFELDTSVRHGGKQALHVVHPAKSAKWVRASVNNIPAMPERTVVLSGWVRATGPWIVTLYEFPTTPGKPYLTHRIAGGAKTDWIHVAGTVRTAPDAKNFKVSLITDGKGEAWFDDFVLADLDTPPSLSIPKLAAVPKLDGTPDDPAWNEAQDAGSFWKLGGAGAPPAVRTRARVGFNGNTLYIAWTCSEPLMDRLRGKKPTEEPSWNDETAEFFLMPGPGTGGYWHLGVTPAGGKLEEAKASAGSAYAVDWYSTRTSATARRKLAVPAWKAAAHRGKNAWTAEMAVPLDKFPNALRPGVVWRLQFARARKITGTEEDSCWAYTPGKTFHAPEHFGNAAPPVWDRFKPETVTAHSVWSNSELRIVPTPQHMTALRQPPRELRKTVSVAVRTPQDPGPAARALRRVLKQFGAFSRFCSLNDAAGADFLIAGPGTGGAGGAQSPLQSSLPKKMPAWQANEAYTLDTAARPALLIAHGARGRFYAVQTLRQLLQTNGSRVRLPAVRIADWPELQWRGWHLIAPERKADVEAAKRVVDTLAGLKMNWVAFQIDNRLQYTRDPDLGREGAPTKAQLRGLVQYAEDRLMEVIPMTQCWSHFSYFLRKPEYRDLAEVPNPAPDARSKYWNYCPRNPETHKMLFGMIEEQLECFPHARYFHCGLDEIRFEPICVCPRCKGTPGDVMLAEEVNRLHAFLKKKGLTMCMWGDQLLPEHNGGPPYNTAKAITHIPRDIVIFDWHYGPATDYPSVRYFKDHGFRVVASGWYEPLNVINLSRTAFDEKILGYGGTTWYGIGRIRDEIRLITAMPLAAENSWSPEHPAINKLPYRPADVFRALYDVGPAPARAARFAFIDLQPWMNRALADDDRHLGALGLGAENDLSGLPTGRREFAGVPFDVVGPEHRQCIVLAAAGDAPVATPEQAWPIPVNTRARALAFLHTCTHPARFSRHIYDRQHVNPGEIVRYEVTYADGSKASVACRWNREISDWNSQLGSAYGRTAWTGKTRGGALARIESFQWTNPHPEKKIATLGVVTQRSPVRPVLIAVTAILQPGSTATR